MKQVRKVYRQQVYISIGILLVEFFCSAYPGFSQAANTKIHTLEIKSSKDLHRFFSYTGKDIPLISGHRGGTTKGYPENCIATFEHTLAYTPAFFEIDPRLTKDSVIVLMHDATLERTTTGHGKVSEYTWEELQQLKLKDSEGNVTPFTIPTLSEVLEWSKGKTIINVDKKDVALPMIAKLLQQHEAETPVMLTVHKAEQARFYYAHNPNRMFSAFIRSRQEFDDFENSGIPWSQIMAYVGPVSKAENKQLYELLHNRGIMCMISAAPSYDKLPDPVARQKAYREIIQAGANVIESDLPIEVANAIAPLIPAKSLKQPFFSK